MLEKIAKLIKREEEIKERFAKVNKASESIRQIVKVDRFLEYPYLLKLLDNKAHDLKEMQMKVWEKIAKEQSKCDHKLPNGMTAHTSWRGNDHNWDYYTCIYCNHEDKR